MMSLALAADYWPLKRTGKTCLQNVMGLANVLHSKISIFPYLQHGVDQEFGTMVNGFAQ